MITAMEANTYRHRLLTLLKRLDRDRSQLKDEALRPEGGEASGGLSDVPLHPADLGSHAYEEEINLRLLEKDEQLIEEINAALDRLKQGTFGQCEICLQEIPQERLAVVPYARRCVACVK